MDQSELEKVAREWLTRNGFAYVHLSDSLVDLLVSVRDRAIEDAIQAAIREPRALSQVTEEPVLGHAIDRIRALKLGGGRCRS